MLDSNYHMTSESLKSQFEHEIVKILSICMQCCYGRHYIS